MPSKIAHISYYLPANIFTNDDYFKLFPELKGNKNFGKIGVEQRVISGDNEVASDMAVKAAKKLFEQTGISPNDIDFLLYASVDLDYYTPATSVYIHGQLGLSENCGTLDQTHGCSAYVYGLLAAKGLVDNGYKNVLLLNANTLTKTLHPKDRSSRFIFGDAASATLITFDEKAKIGNCVVGTDSTGLEKIILRDGGCRNPINEKSFIEKADEYGNVTSDGKFYMDGTSVFLFSIKRVPKVVEETLAKNGLSLDQVDLFIFHQANLYIINTIAKKMGIPDEKLFNNMQMIGNTVGVSIPLAYAQAVEAGKIKPGNKVMFIGFGVGLSWSATVIEAV